MSNLSHRLVPLLAIASLAVAQDAVVPESGPVLGTPTLHSLGMHWIVRGDDDGDASVAVSYRSRDMAEWKPALPLHRVRKNAHVTNGKYVCPTKLQVPDDGWLFAGSILFLDPTTAYEVKLTLSDPDGGNDERVLQASTIAEPVLPIDPPTIHVIPGDGGGSGSEVDPFRGLPAAQSSAKPGMRIRFGAGTYLGPFKLGASGEPGKPILWEGPESGEAVLDGQGAKMVIRTENAHDVWFHRLAIRNAGVGIAVDGSSRLVVTRCHISAVGYGIQGNQKPGGAIQGFFIADNLFEGRLKWLLPFAGDKEADRIWSKFEERAVELGGNGSVVCHNTINHFKDGVDVITSVDTCDNDIHNNLITECIDDGIEFDYSERNNRAYHNRIINTLTGISVQPVFGGPVYAVRNELYNVASEPFKIHNSPSGCLFFHNTSVHRGMPFSVSSAAMSYDITFRNNLFIGTEGRALNFDEPSEGHDLDYDGFGGASGDTWMKFNNVRYSTYDEAKAKAPVERHSVVIDPATVFASGVLPPAVEKDQQPHDIDLRLKDGGAAVDAGAPLANINDGHAGKAPDLGALEIGAPLPACGVRPEKR
jgi:hypothetical protein